MQMLLPCERGIGWKMNEAGAAKKQWMAGKLLHQVAGHRAHVM